MIAVSCVHGSVTALDLYNVLSPALPRGGCYHMCTVLWQ